MNSVTSTVKLVTSHLYVDMVVITFVIAYRETGLFLQSEVDKPNDKTAISPSTVAQEIANNLKPS